MALSKRAQEICDQLDQQNPKMGDVKKLAAKIKKRPRTRHGTMGNW